MVNIQQPARLEPAFPQGGVGLLAVLVEVELGSGVDALGHEVHEAVVVVVSEGDGAGEVPSADAVEVSLVDEGEILRRPVAHVLTVSEGGLLLRVPQRSSSARFLSPGHF